MNTIDRRTFFKIGAAISTLPLFAKEKKDSQELSLIHITDSHMDLQDTDSVTALELAVSFINKHYPSLDCVLFGGDNFNNNVAGDKDAKTFRDIISKLHCPSYVVAGNKEVSPKPKTDKQNFDDFAEMFFTNVTQVGRDWFVEKNGYIILGLNSNIDHHNNGYYTEETLNFAQKMLQKNKPTIILNHHPYINYWKSTDPKDIHKYVLNNGQKTIDLLFRYDNLILTLSGHKHVDNISTINGTKAITTRGFIRPIDLDQYPMRYIKLNGKEIEEKLIYTV
jgi:Icc protein